MLTNVMRKENQEIKVIKAISPEQIEHCFDVRKVVFMEEQMISEEDEFDGFDSGSSHFLVTVDNIPVAAARSRPTTNGVKLERFCTLKEYRGLGLASKLVESVIADCQKNFPDKKMYLYAQVDVIPLYKKFGFIEEGERFMECDIQHQAMVIIN